MAKRDYYDVLGVSKTSTPDEIKKAHRKAVRLHHPDVSKNDPNADAKFKEAQEAYDVLSDDVKRKKYDQFGHAGVGADPGVDPMQEAFRRAQAGGGNYGPRAGYRKWQGTPQPGADEMDGLGGEGGFSDIFEQFFGTKGARGGPPTGRPRTQLSRGEDIEYPVTLTFPQAARGMTLPLQISREGRLETIDVKIPAGVKEGSRVRIKGKGQHTHGEPGDLFIVTRVLPHAYFRREGLDIQLDVPISLYEAIGGTKVEVPTLDGPVVITVPPGTSSGAKLRIKERGFHRGTENGDQYCIIKVMVPKGFDEADKELLKQLQNKHPLDARKDVGW